MLNFEEFQRYVENHIREHLPDDWANAEISMQKVQKNNGLELNAILVKSEDSNIAPTIYLDDFYKHYQEGRDMNDILEKVADIAINNQGTAEIADIGTKFRDFDFVKDRVVVIAVNAEKNRDI